MTEDAALEDEERKALLAALASDVRAAGCLYLNYAFLMREIEEMIIAAEGTTGPEARAERKAWNCERNGQEQGTGDLHWTK